MSVRDEAAQPCQTFPQRRNRLAHQSAQRTNCFWLWLIGTGLLAVSGWVASKITPPCWMLLLTGLAIAVCSAAEPTAHNTVTVSLPAWFFVAVQDKTSWSIQDENVGSLLKITAGRFLTAQKTVVLAAEYETPLDPVAARGVVMMVGVFLGYFYSW